MSLDELLEIVDKKAEAAVEELNKEYMRHVEEVKRMVWSIKERFFKHK